MGEGGIPRQATPDSHSTPRGKGRRERLGHATHPHTYPHPSMGADHHQPSTHPATGGQLAHTPSVPSQAVRCCGLWVEDRTQLWALSPGFFPCPQQRRRSVTQTILMEGMCTPILQTLLTSHSCVQRGAPQAWQADLGPSVGCFTGSTQGLGPAVPARCSRRAPCR